MANSYKDTEQFTIPSFVCEAHWESYGLIIECPSPAAQAFVHKALETNPIVVKMKEKTKR